MSKLQSRIILSNKKITCTILVINSFLFHPFQNELSQILLTIRFFRLATPDTRTRSLSPGAEIKEGNKRPAVICDFFAQGWCIRGSSCRFLHIKDNLNNTTQKSKVEADAVNWKKVQVDKGILYLLECGCPRSFSSMLILISSISCYRFERHYREIKVTWFS